MAQLKSQKIMEFCRKVIYNWIRNAYPFYISHVYIHIKITTILHGQAHLRILTEQKYDIRIIFHEEKEVHARALFKEIPALNIYQINFLQILTFVCKK